MMVSAEVRWFWVRQCPAEVDQWFRGRSIKPGGGDLNRPRTDQYLRLKGNIELGVKVRDAKPGQPPDVEVKGLVETASSKELILPSQTYQLWCKWKGPQIDMEKSVTTRKVRWLRKFDADQAEPVEVALGSNEKPLDDRSLPKSGCNIELTRVETDLSEDVWWTLGFEAFGSVASAPKALVAVANALPRLPTLDGRRLSYPEWLEQL
jgi:hypothetical protein